MFNTPSHASLISDTGAFRHDFLQYLTPMPSNQLIHRLRILTDAIQDAPNISCNNLLNAIANPCDHFSN